MHKEEQSAKLTLLMNYINKVMILSSSAPFDILHFSLPYFLSPSAVKHKPPKHSFFSKGFEFMSDRDRTTTVLCVLALGTARRGQRGVCCGLAISRVKRDFPLRSQWECDIDKVFALPPPSYQLTREHMPVST